MLQQAQAPERNEGDNWRNQWQRRVWSASPITAAIGIDHPKVAVAVAATASPHAGVVDAPVPGFFGVVPAKTEWAPHCSLQKQNTNKYTARIASSTKYPIQVQTGRELDSALSDGEA
jgi:L-serine deaminase